MEETEPIIPAGSGTEPETEHRDEIAEEQLLLEVKASDEDTDAALLRATVEAAVYITDEPLTAKEIAEALDEPVDRVTKALEELAQEYERPEHGLTIRQLAEGYKMGTKAEHHEAIRAFVKKLQKPLKLSMAALETLAVVAYKQPITAPEIMDIRGVQGAGVLKTLLDRKLITTAGRKNVVGKPILYRTTKDFLVQFGLKNTSELPTLKEFEELARIALADSEEIEGIEAPETTTAEVSEGAPAETTEPEGAGTEPKGPVSETAEVEEEAEAEKRAASSDD
jgi:segregation and condensation protein B